jgi:hypothetical protein
VWLTLSALCVVGWVQRRPDPSNMRFLLLAGCSAQDMDDVRQSIEDAFTGIHAPARTSLFVFSLVVCILLTCFFFFFAAQKYKKGKNFTVDMVENTRLPTLNELYVICCCIAACAPAALCLLRTHKCWRWCRLEYDCVYTWSGGAAYAGGVSDLLAVRAPLQPLAPLLFVLVITAGAHVFLSLPPSGVTEIP